MQGLEPFDEDGSGTVFRDVVMLALSGFVAIVLLLLPHLNIPTKDADAAEPPGNLIVEIRWPDQYDTDVDLWVKAPDDVPVGYSNKGGLFFNLLRDDLGHRADATDINYEVSYSRGFRTGEYVVNVHLFRIGAAPLPIPVKVVVTEKPKKDALVRQIVSTKVDLHYEGQEATALRFTLDKNGALVPGSVHSLPKPLRSARG